MNQRRWTILTQVRRLKKRISQSQSTTHGRPTRHCKKMQRKAAHLVKKLQRRRSW